MVVGQELTIVPAYPVEKECAVKRTGTVLDIVGNEALLDTYACVGNSGAPVYDAEGNLVGVVVAMTSKKQQALVELF